MRYHRILKYDTANGPGIRTTIWFTGCCFRCPDCFNHDIQDPNTGADFDDKAKAELFSYLSDSHVTGISILGGEPLIQGQELIELLSEIKERFPDKTIWIWTGFQLQNIIDSSSDALRPLKLHEFFQYNDYLSIIRYADYLVDGPYMKDKTTYHTRFRGSANQTIWHIKPAPSETLLDTRPCNFNDIIRFIAYDESEIFDKQLEHDSNNIDTSHNALTFSIISG